MSPQEEDAIAEDLAGSGWTRDVLNILASSSPTAQPRIVPPHDWRWKWVEKTLRRLEATVPTLLFERKYLALYEHQTEDEFLMPPPLQYPLHPRPRIAQKFADRFQSEEHHAKHVAALESIEPPYSLLLVESPESNAFSYGFGGNGGGGVVVYTGFLDEVMGTPLAPEPLLATLASTNALSSLFSFKPPPKPRSDPLPTISQTTKLATLLSHEVNTFFPLILCKKKSFVNIPLSI